MSDSSSQGVSEQIDGLHQEFRSYKEESLAESKRRHADQVQVLFAIAVLGWFFSNYKEWINSLLNPSLLKLVFAFAAIISISFLILKMAVSVFQPSLSLWVIGTPERAIRYLYVILVSIIVIAIPVVAISNVIMGLFPEIKLDTLSIANFVITLFSSLYVVKRYVEKREELFKKAYVDVQNLYSHHDEAVYLFRIDFSENMSLDPKDIQISLRSVPGLDADFLDHPSGFVYNAREGKLENPKSLNVTSLSFRVGVRSEEIHHGQSRNIVLEFSTGDQTIEKEVEVNFETH